MRLSFSQRLRLSAGVPEKAAELFAISFPHLAYHKGSGREAVGPVKGSLVLTGFRTETGFLGRILRHFDGTVIHRDVGADSVNTTPSSRQRLMFGAALA